MPRMAFGRIAAPIHDEISSVLNFAECAGDFAAQLGCDFCGTMSQRGVAVHQSAEMIGHRHALLLRLASRIAHAIHERQVGIVE